jgi:hypothetical protein
MERAAEKQISAPLRRDLSHITRLSIRDQHAVAANS